MWLRTFWCEVCSGVAPCPAGVPNSAFKAVPARFGAPDGAFHEARLLTSKVPDNGLECMAFVRGVDQQLNTSRPLLPVFDGD